MSTALGAATSPLLDLKNFVSRHPTWSLSLVPFLLVSIKLFGCSGGNAETFLYLLQNVNVVTLLLASLVPLIPQVTFWIFVVAVIRTWPDTINRSTKAPLWVVVAIVSLWGIVLLMPRGILALHVSAALILAVFRVCKARSRRHNASTGSPAHESPSKSLLVVSFAAAVAALFSSSVMWAPTEILQIRNWRYVGYVLTTNEDWTTVMELNNNVRIFKTSDIESRKPCAENGWWQRPAYAPGRADPQHVNCKLHWVGRQA